MLTQKIIKNEKFKGFTLVELIVVTTILTILAAIWFSSYVSNLPDARDAQRQSDIAQISAALKKYHQDRWRYPLPWITSDYFWILNSWTLVATQWKMNKNVKLPTLDNIPSDPKAKIPYFYSITKNKQEYELIATLENWDTPITLLKWDYKTVSKNILPSISLAISSNSDIEIHDWVWSWTENRKKFILNWWSHNLAYDIETKEPYSSSDITELSFLFTDPGVEFWQNTDYRNCTEILNAWKSIWNWEYQILNNTWELTNTWCTGM